MTTTPVYGADSAGTANEREKRNVAIFIKLLGLTGLGQKLGLNRGSGSAYKYGPRGPLFVNPAAYRVAPVYGSYGAGYAGGGFGPVPTADAGFGSFSTAGAGFGSFPKTGAGFGSFPTAGEWDGPAPGLAGLGAPWPVNPPTAVVYGPSSVHGPDVGGYD